MTTNEYLDEMPVCEICKKNPAVSFSNIGEHWKKQEWKYVCICTAKSDDPKRQEIYYIEIGKFFEDVRSMVIWLEQLRGKKWMDWKDFGNMMSRFWNAIAEKMAIPRLLMPEVQALVDHFEKDTLP